MLLYATAKIRKLVLNRLVTWAPYVPGGVATRKYSSDKKLLVPCISQQFSDERVAGSRVRVERKVIIGGSYYDMNERKS